MTDHQRKRCRKIIHSAAAAAAAGNIVPVPGLGVAADLAAMSAMTVSLARVFRGNVNEAVAKGMAMGALKRTVLRQPIRVLTKELSKLVPGLGQLVSPSVSAALVETAGWSIACEFDDDVSGRKNRRTSGPKT